MKVYHPTTGEAYEGEPVDCRELRQVAGYLTHEQHSAKQAKEGKTPAVPEEPKRPTMEELAAALKAVPADARAGRYLNSADATNQLLAQFGVLFTVDVKDQVEAIFKAVHEETAGKAADAVPGKSAKVKG